jgi:transcriptional regulator with XRE-family HTH domain
MNSPINVTRLKREMFVRGLDEGKLAELSGVSTATISHLVSGKSAQNSTIHRVAMALVKLPAVAELEALSPFEPDVELVAQRKRAELDQVVDRVLERIVAKLREQSRRLRLEEEKQFRRHRSEMDRLTRR